MLTDAELDRYARQIILPAFGGAGQAKLKASHIAVIDSDYQVEPFWLRRVLPYFADPSIALVQGPQDYRDGRENLFKAMAYEEYRGFFHIGMVERNENNAIIQHGTMTIVSRRA